MGSTEWKQIMRRLNISMVGQINDSAARTAIKEIELASAENDLLDIANGFIITGSYTETRTLNVGTSTLAETQAFIATFIADCKRGGQHRTT
jgi:hypothetical protein